MGHYTVPTRPARRVIVRSPHPCGICGQTILKGERAEYYSWTSHTGFRKEWLHPPSECPPPH